MPYPLSGVVYDVDGSTVKASVTVTVRNERTNDTLTAVSNASGQYVMDLANFSSDYVTGDLVSVFVIYENYEVTEVHDVTVGGGTVNLTLSEVPASDSLRYFTVQDFYDYFNFVTPTGSDTNTPSPVEVVRIGVGVEKEIDTKLKVVFNDGPVEVVLDDCDSTSGWAASTDGTAASVDTTEANFRYRDGCLKLGKDGTSEALVSYSKTLDSTYDFTDKVLLLWVYVTATSVLATAGTGIRLKVGSDSTNYYYEDWYASDLEAGWNLLYFKQSEAGTSGTPVTSQCDYLQIYVTTTAITTTITSGNIRMDRWQLVREDMFFDDYADTDYGQHTYFVLNKPLSELFYFGVNSSEEDETPSWSELEESDNEINVRKSLGRIRITDDENYSETGSDQVRMLYSAGYSNVPADIRKLAILMVGRDISHTTGSRQVVTGQGEFNVDAMTVFDAQIESIKDVYRQSGVVRT